MAYNTTEAVAKFLSGFQMKITNRERDTVAPDYYVKYSLTLSKGGKDFSTTFVSDPGASGEPTVTQVFSALADDALTLRKYSTDEFVDKLYAQGVKPSAALRAYDSCKETNLWMQDELYLSGWEIEEISKTLTKYEDEVNTLVEKAASERTARYAYDHPKLPKGFVTIEQLQGDLDLGDLRDEVEDFDFDGDITEAFGETAEYKVDDNYHALLTRCSPSSGRPSFLSAISTRKRFPLTAKRTIWKTAGMGLMVTPRKRMPRKRTIEMRSRL